MIPCSRCGERLDATPAPAPVASISGGILGDEYTDSYFFCDRCGVYTVEVYRDRFLDEGEAALRGPVPRAEGDRAVELIRRCAEPWDKKCRCPAHRAYFGDSLD